MSAYVFGAVSAKPITNLPEGAKVRIRLRDEEFAAAYVRYQNRIEQWALRDNLDGTWALAFVQASNVRVQQQ